MGSRRVAVIGMTRSGKTTLICAMIDHWLNHPNGNRLHFRDGDRLICRWKQPVSEGRRHFEAARDRFCDGQWPKKSLQPMNYQLSWRFAAPAKIIGFNVARAFQTIELADIPGERLADIEMLICKNLREWSQQMVHKFRSDFKTRQFFGAFDQLYSLVPDADRQLTWADELEAAYRSFIANLIVNKHPLVTPSSMLIDRHGDYVPKQARGTVEALTEWLQTEAHLGLSPGQKLFPIPEPLLKTSFGRSMEKVYQAYVKQVVRPALASLFSADDIVITVDVAAILQEGPSWKNFTDYFLSKISDTLEPSGMFLQSLKKIWNLISYVGTAGFYTPRSVQRVFLVSTQADRIHDQYQEALSRLVNSLKQHGLRRLMDCGGIQVEAFPLAAVVSTVSRENDLQYMRSEIDGVQDVVVPIREIPEEFPDDWSPDQFQFPIALTRMPKNKATPSIQRNLDKLSQLLLQ